MTRPGRLRARRLELAIFAGGAAGALARAGVDRALPWDGHGWPWATFSVNVAGAALVGYLVTRLTERLPPSTLKRPLLGTGFCGAMTTFSTVQVEAIQLARHDDALLAAAYVAASAAVGFTVLAAATGFTRRARVW